ncbi:MAG: hypothetical protein WBN96_08415 [Gammaproteobacteria bacterium]
MRNIILPAFSILLISGCVNLVTSEMAEKVTLYKDESQIPANCERLGEVTAGVCANTSPCPDVVMKKHLREKAYMDYRADTVWLYNTTLSGTEVVGHGIAYKCNEVEEEIGSLPNESN